jgi:glycosyltransferase involved in cell wall biosynthesis
MKRVLIITYYWPPTGGGGVQRWLKFVKYFRQFGIEPIVFTPKNPERPSTDESLIKEIPQGIEIIGNKIWEPYSFYKKFTGRKKSEKIQTAFLSEKKTKSSLLENISIWIRGNFFIPDARKFWIKPSVKYLQQYLKDNKVDAIISTGPPHSAHMIGLGLKQKTNIPWLADFRDPWTNIDYYKELKLGTTADKKHHKLEKEVLKCADAVSVISPGMYREFEGIVKRKYHIIPNGFDEEDISKDISVKKSEYFVLSHIGSLTKTRTPLSLLKVLGEMVLENPDFAKKLKIRNVGKLDINALECIRKYDLEKHLEIINYLPHNEVISEQSSASMLLLLINNTPNAKLILTGKIFEYLASGRPIICIAPSDGDAANVIRETNSGKPFDFYDTKNLKAYLTQSFEQFTQGKLTNNCDGIEKYSRRNLTQKMAEALKDIS